MAMGFVKCMLGFSTTYTAGVSERLERSASELDQRFRRAQTNLLEGLESLHDAVDSALLDAGEQSASCLSRGLAELTECECCLTAMIEALMRVRCDLADADSGDPLIDRERFFGVIDYGELYRTMATRGAALPQRVFWEEVVSAVKSGGARAGVQLLEDQLRELLANLCNYIRAVEGMRRLPAKEFAHSLHSAPLEVPVLVMGFTRFLCTCTYVSIICGHAMHLYEQELVEVAAAAS